MLTEEQAVTPIPINCYDAVITTQLIEKLLRNGLVTGRELMAVAGLRIKMMNLVHQATGVDLDNPKPDTVETKDAE